MKSFDREKKYDKLIAYLTERLNLEEKNMTTSGLKIDEKYRNGIVYGMKVMLIEVEKYATDEYCGLL